jgi:hypothetical protein
MEYKALSRGESSGSAPKKRATVPVRAKRKLVESAPRPTTEVASWGAVYLDATEFAEFEKCIQTPQKPTQSIVKAAEMIRELYGKNR